MDFTIGNRVRVTFLGKTYLGIVCDVEHDGTVWIELDNNEGRMDFRQSELSKHVSHA